MTTGGVIVDVNSAPLARPAFSTEEQIKRAKKIYSGEAVTQVVTIFQKYDGQIIFFTYVILIIFHS